MLTTYCLQFLDKNHDGVVTLGEMVKVDCPSDHLLACVAALRKHILLPSCAAPHSNPTSILDLQSLYLLTAQPQVLGSRMLAKKMMMQCATS